MSGAIGGMLRTVPGRSPLHRAPVWAKYLGLLALGVVGTVWRDWPVALGLTVLSVLAYAAAGRVVLRSWASPLRWWWVLLALGAYQWWADGPGAAVGLAGTMFSLLQFARLLLLTTPTAVLMDSLARACVALRLPPSPVELTLAIILRTLPDLSLTWVRVREAAAARGLRRAPLRTATALTITAVARARDVGDALAARGLPESSGLPESRRPSESRRP